jgi:CO/xanthine dehydrogenase FAD-binding subunit
VRCPSVERALADGADPATAAERVLDDVEPHDDALASAWYRKRMLPKLVARALGDLSGRAGKAGTASSGRRRKRAP